ncbi:MAG: ABC transporter permease [Thermoplasmatota archaeon]
MSFWQLYARNMRQMPRIPVVLVFGIAMPIIQLLLFGSVFSNTLDTPGHPYNGVADSYYEFIAPAIILLTAVLGMANSSAAFIVDLRTGYFDKLRTTPASPAGVIFARLLAESTRVGGQALIILLLAVALGARVETGAVGAVVMILVGVLFGLLTTGLAVMILAMKTRSDQATQSVFPLFFVLLFLSEAFMPGALLPDWLQTIIDFNPVNYVIVGLRDLMFEGWADALPDLAIGLGLALIIGGLLALINRRTYRQTILG